MQCELGMPDMYFYKAVEKSGSEKKIVGFAKWTVENSYRITGKDIDKETPQGKGEKTTSNSSFHPPEVPEEDSNEVFFDDWMPEIIEIRHKHLAGKQTMVLDDLCVWPNHQRQGVGTLLLRNLLDFADKRGLPCYLESTPLAYTMYTRQGFENVDTVGIDLQQWRQGYGVYRTAIIYREAQRTPEHKSEQNLIEEEEQRRGF